MSVYQVKYFFVILQVPGTVPGNISPGIVFYPNSAGKFLDWPRSHSTRVQIQSEVQPKPRHHANTARLRSDHSSDSACLTQNRLPGLPT
jgi:hypothetical protein